MLSCERYDLAEKQIKAFTRSSIRAKIMLCLKEGPKVAVEMEDIIGARVSTILHAIKEMSDEDLVVKTTRGYALTNIGRIQAYILDELINAIVVLDKHKEFWLTHDLSGIPVELQMRIGVLIKGEILKGDPMAILRTQEYFTTELRNAKEIHGVSPIIVPGYAEAISIAVKNGAQVDLVLTNSILKIVLQEHRDTLRDLLLCEDFKLYRIDDDIKVAFTVTDKMLSLGLFRLDKSYDVSSDLNCIGPEPRKWGIELFAYYLSRSERICSI